MSDKPQTENIPSAETPHTVELPKDSQGRVLDPKGQPLLTPRGVSHTWSLDYDSGKWLVSCQTKHGEDVFNPEECTLLIAPYDKHGRTIKVGDWVKKADDDKAVKIVGIHHEKDGIVLSFDSGWYVWDKVGSPYFEIVPDHDSVEQLKKDAEYSATAYCVKHGVKYDRGRPYQTARLHMIDRAYKLGRESRG